MAVATNNNSLAPKAKKINKKDQEMIDGVKAGFQGSENRSLLLSDNVLLEAIERAGTKWDEMDENQIVAFLKTIEETATAMAITDMGISVLVGKLDGDDAAVAEIGEEIEAEMKGKVRALNLYSHFKRIFTRAEMDGMPYPGSSADEPVGNYKLDIVKTKATNGDSITTTWTNDFVSSMGWGKGFETEMDDIAKEEKAQNSSKKYRGWSTQDLLSAKANYTSRRNALRSMIKKVIELHHQFEAVLGMQKVGIQWIETITPNAPHIKLPKGFGKKEPTISVVTSPKPLWIYPEGNQGKGKVYSIGQLLAFNVQVAIANGGSMADLTATSGKGADDPNKVEGEGDGSNMTDDEFYSNFNRQVNYFNKTANLARFRQILADKKHEHRKDFLENLNTLMAVLTPVYNQNKKAIQDVIGSPTETPKTDAA